jgi:hypothetical protein
MPQATCIFNGKKQQYLIIPDVNVETRSKNLVALEAQHSWNLTHDDIYIGLLTCSYALYKRLNISIPDTGGRSEPELLGPDYFLKG